MFFNKNKPIYLDCYTSDRRVYEYSKIARGKEFYPEWWKQLKHTSSEGTTAKKCFAIHSLYNNSIVIPMWTDTQFIFGEDRDELAVDTVMKDCFVHPVKEEQRKGFRPEKDWAHISFSAPWAIRCSEDINFVFMEDGYSNPTPEAYHLPSGVLEFKYQSALQLNFMVNTNLSTRKNFSIPHNRPMVHLLPMTEREVILRNHYVSKDRLYDVETVFPYARNNRYAKSKKHKKEQEESKGFLHKVFGNQEVGK